MTGFFTVTTIRHANGEARLTDRLPVECDEEGAILASQEIAVVYAGAFSGVTHVGSEIIGPYNVRISVPVRFTPVVHPVPVKKGKK